MNSRARPEPAGQHAVDHSAEVERRDDEGFGRVFMRKTVASRIMR